MSARFEQIANRRAIIDRRVVADELRALAAIPGDAAARRHGCVEVLRRALKAGRAELARRIEEAPQRGHDLAGSYAFLTDQLLRLAYDFTTVVLCPLGNPTAAERMTLVAVGGYGRGEMAPFSDVDILFLTPWKQTAWGEQVIETLLYMLWDLGLKVGHASRSLDEMVRMAKSDLTIKTALLESRFIWGDQALYDEAARRYRAEVVAGDIAAFTAAKLAERDARHKKMGDSRYVVEPNIKEGKGGLRDLHALYWIGKYAYQAEAPAELVDKGLLTPAELRQFARAENFLWAVRISLHNLVGRAEERLTFDVQRELAARFRYADRNGLSATERFMRHYFLIAKQVGALTGVFLAHLEQSFGKRRTRWRLPSFRRAPRDLGAFRIDSDRIASAGDDFFREDPVRLIELFTLADRNGLEVHPLTMRQASRDAGLITAHTRRDPRANALFLELLTSTRNSEAVLRWMNEAGVFGRFVPDFGRVVAQMQYDMYHHYTVDEHSIRAIGLLARIDRGDLKDELPLASSVVHQLLSRRALYVAVLLHDIAKGRGGDHSVLGADVALKLCPRLGLNAAETEIVAWLVRHHLLMSATAFKRDLTDYKTVLDFAEQVQSMERLRLLLVLTTVDIHAVGPGVWTSWKGQLLGDLYEAAEELLRLGHKQKGRKERIAARQQDLGAALGWPQRRFAAYAKRFYDAYWIAETPDSLLVNATLIAAADREERRLAVSTTIDMASETTLVSAYAADHPGLFYRIAGAISLAGANILDARIHTTRDGMALDNLVVQDPLGGAFDEPARLERLRVHIEEALAGRIRLADRLAARPLARRRADSFRIEPNVLIDDKASNRYTVIEVNALDRPALLYSLTYALFQARVTIHSAHIATYGERAVDVFYVTDLTGEKLRGARAAELQARLLAAARGNSAAVAA